MARIVLGRGTSHSPMLALPAERWPAYAEGDRRNGELTYPPHGYVTPFDEALEQKDAQTLQSLPRERLYSATSESLSWVVVGGAMANTPLRMELVDYVPVYRTPAGTGGGWAFARWQ